MAKEVMVDIKKIYGLEISQVWFFVHYHPQFYHFHVHFTRLENEVGCEVEKGHLVSDIVQNLDMDSDYYTKRMISFRLRTTDNLYKKLSETTASKISIKDNMEME